MSDVAGLDHAPIAQDTTRKTFGTRRIVKIALNGKLQNTVGARVVTIVGMKSQDVRNLLLLRMREVVESMLPHGVPVTRSRKIHQTHLPQNSPQHRRLKRRAKKKRRRKRRLNAR